MTCKVFNKRGTCSWQKDNKPVGIYHKKYEWAGVQDSGDCSLWVRAATLEFDNGEWECQVTASDFTTQDALTSSPVRLVVRVAPQRPRIEYNTSQVLPGHNVTAQAGERATVKCVSRYGNPPARLKWLLGDEEITTSTNQSNSTELDNDKTWVATSVLELGFSKQQHGSLLKCVALHESYSTKSQVIEVRLNVRYPPEVRLKGAPTQDLEEGRDSVVLMCVADANPVAKIVWKRAGRSDIVSLEETLQFRPVARRDTGTYTCEAQNIVGSSEPLSVHIDVKYPPQIVDVGPDRVMTAPLYSQATFSCTAEGNPTPTYQWLQKLPTAEGTVLIRGSDARLHINNVTYDYKGEYVCKATNMIAGVERVVQSDAISVQVVGAPQVLRQSGGREVVVARGQDALLRLVVCADPRPRRAAWEWGSQQLEAGADQGRYKAEELAQVEREDCYEARLHVREVDPADSRNYYLAVQNERGTDRHAVYLDVREPVSMATLLSLAAGSLLLLLILVSFTVYALRREKCCFARRGDFRPTDLESEKSDVDSAAGRKTPRLDNQGLGGGGAIPAEAIYSTSPSRRPHTITGGSPEAMKRRCNISNNSGRATKTKKDRDTTKDNLYADLQVPTISNNGSTMTMTMLNKVNPSSPSKQHLQSDNYFQQQPHRTTNDYFMSGHFQPNSFERAEI
ncbi:hemicentin-1 isoform X3 [Zootermopsis nevadensis]|nr:hemicentin-1 isoform X3 [Zootermopsis nevadensis]XP_021939889.1 hemicentin-1 isoform X3 [Zootermopsis nevadensis]XP_021939890.1 hemicentin-1 isoform X3 [Zootermopsis nevadensis]